MNNSIREYLKFSDLSGLDSSPNDVRSAFAREFGETPDGIALNKETYYDAVHPPITEDYGHYCYKTLGSYQFTADSSGPPEEAVVGSNTVQNHGDSPAEINLTVEGELTETIAWSSSITTGFSFSGEFSIEGVFKTGSSFSVDITAGKSGSHSIKKGVSSRVVVSVPPKSQVTVQSIATITKETLDYSVPINVTGMFGANFPNEVEGHYFWFLSASQVLPKTRAEITGSIEGTAAVDVHTRICPAVPIQS